MVTKTYGGVVRKPGATWHCLGVMPHRRMPLTEALILLHPLKHHRKWALEMQSQDCSSEATKDKKVCGQPQWIRRALAQTKHVHDARNDAELSE